VDTRHDLHQPTSPPSLTNALMHSGLLRLRGPRAKFVATKHHTQTHDLANRRGGLTNPSTSTNGCTPPLHSVHDAATGIS
jgi:hypothetical protein